MTLDRVIFRALVPALLLPVIAAVTAILGTSNRPSTGDFDAPIMGLVVAVYMFVLLGSMTLNAWLLLRHPESFTARVLPRRITVMLVLLYGLLLAWIVVLAFGIVGGVSVAFGIVLAGLSIVICLAALGRRLSLTPGVAVTTVALPTSARVIAVAYLVVTVLVLLGTLGGFATGQDGSQAGGALGGPWTWGLLVLGLPWSHPLYFAAVVLSFLVGSSLGELYWLTPVLVSLSVVVNLVLVSRLVWSPTWRTTITNWFFRLRPAVAAEEPPAPPS